MSEHAATPTGAADGSSKPTAQEDQRPIVRLSRQEMVESIGKRRVETFNKEQREAGSEEFVPVTGELKPGGKGGEEDEEDVDNDDLEAERERARLVAEAAAKDAEERKAKGAKAAEVERQLDADDRVTVIDDPSKYRLKIKVDGKEEIVDLDSAVRASQMEKAAADRLRQASETMKIAEEREAAAAVKLKEADDALKAKAERELKSAQEAREHAKKNLGDRLKEHAGLLYDGKTEEAAKLLAEILEPVYERSAEPAPTQKAAEVDVRALKAEVKKELKTELKTEGALETFANDYPEIVKDPNLAAIADRFFEAELKKGASEHDAFKSAGKATRDYVKGVAAQLGMSEAGRSKTTGRESLEKRKAEIDEPETASLGVSLKDTAPEQQSARSVIAEMAASRVGAAAAAAAAKREAQGR